jgi:hypothetical protein
MRIISIILILILTSCSAMKIKRMYNKEEKHQDKEYLNTDDDGVTDFFDADTLVNNIVEDKLEYTVSKSISFSPIRNKENNINNKENNLNVIDKTTENIDNSSKGTIAYSVPNEMEVGKEYVIKLRITKERGKEVNKVLVLGDRDILISDIDVNSRVTIENIRVEKSMTAQLISTDEAFIVTPQNTDRQLIEDQEYTEWGWLVKPLKSGNSYLKLIIKIRIDSDGEATYKDIVVFDKNIKVKSDIKYDLKTWLSKYWQWLMTTIIIPLVIFFYKKRKNKDNVEV